MWSVSVQVMPDDGQTKRLPVFHLAPGILGPGHRGVYIALTAMDMLAEAGASPGVFHIRVSVEGEAREAWTYTFVRDPDGAVRLTGRAARTIDCGGGDTVMLTGDVQCDCGEWFNRSGGRLRGDWRGNRSVWDEDVSDLDGYEAQYAGDQ